MRLNLDCVRDILLVIEEHTTPRQQAMFIDLSTWEDTAQYLGDEECPVQKYQMPLVDTYGNDKLIYHLNYCIKADLLERNDQLSDPVEIIISDITPRGHEFLANIRPTPIWDKAKTVIEKLGITSLPAAIQISGAVASEFIKAHLGL